MRKFLILFVFIVVFVVGCSKSGDNVKSDGGGKVDTAISNNSDNSNLDNLSIVQVKDYVVIDKDMEFGESDFNKAIMIFSNYSLFVRILKIY